jgi:hypothetical protein
MSSCRDGSRFHRRWSAAEPWRPKVSQLGLVGQGDGCWDSRELSHIAHFLLGPFLDRESIIINLNKESW